MRTPSTDFSLILHLSSCLHLLEAFLSSIPQVGVQILPCQKPLQSCMHQLFRSAVDSTLTFNIINKHFEEVWRRFFYLASITVQVYIHGYNNVSNMHSQSNFSGFSHFMFVQSSVIYLIHHTSWISNLWNAICFHDASMEKWQTRENQNLVLGSMEVRVLVPGLIDCNKLF